MQEAPIHQSHVYGRIKISWTIFKKGHPRNIPVKLFQNLICHFREDFLRISSCPYTAKIPNSPEPCLLTVQNLANIFKKGHPRNIPVRLFQNLTSGFRDFLRTSSCPYSARSPHSPEPYIWTNQKFANNFWKGSPKEHSCEIISKSDQRFQGRRSFKNFFMSV